MKDDTVFKMCFVTNYKNIICQLADLEFISIRVKTNIEKRII